MIRLGRIGINFPFFFFGFRTIELNVFFFRRSQTEILIVSSSRDVHSTVVYPTHPYTSKNSSKNVTFLPDPCIVKVNGVTIALTGTDVYSHILDSELAE